MSKGSYNITDEFSKLSGKEKINLLRTMVRIRLFEKSVEKLFLNNKIPGFVHLYIGEEAIAAGMMANLEIDDYITSTHRGHGHAIAKGADMNRMMAELFGRKDGYCKGKGGSMHIADFSIGMLGANGIVGGGYNIAVGAGLSASIRKTKQAAVCFFGDGASNRGTFHEALNMAAIWKLPVVFLNENNQYASTTPSSYALSVVSVADRAQAYNIPGISVDGNDIAAVYNASRYLVNRAKKGDGPSLLECRTFRIKGHFVGDPEKYRTKEEVEHWQGDMDPITRYSKYLIEEKILDQKKIDKIYNDAEKEVAEAVDFAENSPYPEGKEAMDDLFSFSPNKYPEAVQ